MRVKPAAAGSEDGDSDSTTKKSSSSDETFSTMGYTGGAAPSVSYNQSQQAFPNFFDLLQDSPDTADTDSPMPAELEEEFLDMLAESDLAMYPPPPYQGTGYPTSQNGYPSFPNQFIPSYQPYANYMYPQQNNQQQQQQQAVKPAVKPEPNVAASQELMDTSNGAMQKADIYSKGEKLIQNLQLMKPQQDALHSIAKKVGITAESSDNSDDGSTHSAVTAIEVTSRSAAASPSSQGSLSPNSRSSSRKTKASPATPKAKASTSSSSRNSRAKKDGLPIDVPEEILYEEAKSKPIKHRKEPDIVETKDRSVRNAINARVNRQKHKLYVDGLEQEVQDLKNANQAMENRHQDTLVKMSEMQDRIQYLENVIANDTTISSILKSLGQVDSIKISSSLSRKRKRSADTTDSSLGASSSFEPAAKHSGGVCLHVDNKNVSVEFCEKCAESSRKALDDSP